MSLYLAAYDIRDDYQRARVARVLRHYGERIQHSVFELWIEIQELDELKRAIGPLLSKKDCFDLYPIDLHPTRAHLRWQRSPVHFNGVLPIGDGSVTLFE